MSIDSNNSLFSWIEPVQRRIYRNLQLVTIFQPKASSPIPGFWGNIILIFQFITSSRDFVHIHPWDFSHNFYVLMKILCSVCTMYIKVNYLGPGTSMLLVKVQEHFCYLENLSSILPIKSNLLWTCMESSHYILANFHQFLISKLPVGRPGLVWSVLSRIKKLHFLETWKPDLVWRAPLLSPSHQTLPLSRGVSLRRIAW